MKRFILLMTFAMAGFMAYAQQDAKKAQEATEVKKDTITKVVGAAEIRFEKTEHDFGTFPETEPKHSYTFKFTNIGDKMLVIHQAVASCGCTVPEFSKEPIQPGKTGEIKVTYNGTGKFPGYFHKSVMVRTNGKSELVRLYITGIMEEVK